MAQNDYLHKICPYCKTEFTENDDVVICSMCEMPHHKDCWIDNQGCTTFGCCGTIDSPKSADDVYFEIEIYDDQGDLFSDQNKNIGHIFCTRCGCKNLSTYSFCFKCGNSLVPIKR